MNQILLLNQKFKGKALRRSQTFLRIHLILCSFYEIVAAEVKGADKMKDEMKTLSRVINIISFG